VAAAAPYCRTGGSGITLRGYVLDEHGSVRHHVAVFVDGQSIVDRRALDLPPIQALTFA
jgi:hypothetical protein